jgi:hypothetical protein
MGDVNDPDCCRRSFAASIKDTARRLLDDPTIAPRDVSRQRLEICEGCERFQEKSRICDLCGCYMPLKTTMSNMKCPIDRWTEYVRN